MRVLIGSLLAPLLLFCGCMEGAAAGVHAYLAQEWMKMHQEQEAMFIAGALLPDIRYLGTISRRRTHIPRPTIKKIRLSRNSVRGGMAHHAYVDVYREKYVEKTKILTFLPRMREKDRELFLKLLEDQIIWDRIDTNAVQESLKTIYSEELTIGCDHKTVGEWHFQMELYFFQPPADYLALLASKGMPFLRIPPEKTAAWSRLLREHAKNPLFIAYTEAMCERLAARFAKRDHHPL